MRSYRDQLEREGNIDAKTLQQVDKFVDRAEGSTTAARRATRAISSTRSRSSSRASGLRRAARRAERPVRRAVVRRAASEGRPPGRPSRCTSSTASPDLAGIRIGPDGSLPSTRRCATLAVSQAVVKGTPHAPFAFVPTARASCGTVLDPGARRARAGPAGGAGGRVMRLPRRGQDRRDHPDGVRRPGLRQAQPRRHDRGQLGALHRGRRDRDGLQHRRRLRFGRLGPRHDGRSRHDRRAVRSRRDERGERRRVRDRVPGRPRRRPVGLSARLGRAGGRADRVRIRRDQPQRRSRTGG